MLALVAISGCAGVTITDSEWYGSLGVQGAVGFHTLTNQTETLDLQQWATKWDDLTNPLVCTASSTLAEWKGDIEKLCSIEQCPVSVQAAVNEIDAKISAAAAATTKGKTK